MKLVSSALLPVVEGDLQQTVAAFVSVLRDHCKFDAQSRCSLSMITARPKLLALVARALPPGAEEFENFPPARRKMTAAEYLAQMPNSTIADRSACDVTLTNFLSQEQIVSLLSELARALPPSGRDVFLILWVDAVILSGASLPVRGRMSIGRNVKGKQRYMSILFCEFHAKSKSDPAASKTIQELGDALNVEWKKLSVMTDFNRADRPDASEMTVVEQCVQEAFAQSAADLDRVKASLAGGPFFHSRMEAIYKRMGQVTGGIHEKVDFGPEMRQFMRVNFPDYSSCRLGGSAPAFRKRLGDHLDGLLVVERLNGFGKCFSLQYYVDFPGTRFAGTALDLVSSSRSLFSIFHRGMMSPVWVYAVREDLVQALADCGNVLRLALPAIESRLTEFLSPVPTAIPQAMQVRGALCAREAYEEARWTAKAWSADARFVGVHSGGLHVIGHQLSRGVDLHGRLQPHGRWLVRFESRPLRSDLLVEVPHTGQIRWNSMVQTVPLSCQPPSPQWLDSPDAMHIGVKAIQGLAPEHEWTTWECGILEDRSLSAAVWTIHASFGPTPRRPSFRDAYVYLNPVDGSVVHSACLER